VGKCQSLAISEDGAAVWNGGPGFQVGCEFASVGESAAAWEIDQDICGARATKPHGTDAARRDGLFIIMLRFCSIAFHRQLICIATPHPAMAWFHQRSQSRDSRLAFFPASKLDFS
jgi:hypothetical protein